MSKPLQKSVLIAYYSWHGNTRNVARLIQRLTGGDLFEISPAQPYSSDYNEVVTRGKHEMKAGIKPPLAALPDLRNYTTVFLGAPNWWNTIAAPVTTFLDQLDFNNLTLVPFYTHGGGGGGHIVTDMTALAPGATVCPGYGAYNGGDRETENEINKWLRDLELL